MQGNESHEHRAMSADRRGETMDIESLSLRLPGELIGRTDRMCQRLFGIPDLDRDGITRATVLRIAIARGLDALEQEYPERRQEPR